MGLCMSCKSDKRRRIDSDGEDGDGGENAAKLDSSPAPPAIRVDPPTKNSQTGGPTSFPTNPDYSPIETGFSEMPQQNGSSFPDPSLNGDMGGKTPGSADRTFYDNLNQQQQQQQNVDHVDVTNVKPIISSPDNEQQTIIDSTRTPYSEKNKFFSQTGSTQGSNNHSKSGDARKPPFKTIIAIKDDKKGGAIHVLAKNGPDSAKYADAPLSSTQYQPAYSNGIRSFAKNTSIVENPKISKNEPNIKSSSKTSSSLGRITENEPNIKSSSKTTSSLGRIIENDKSIAKSWDYDKPLSVLPDILGYTLDQTSPYQARSKIGTNLHNTINSSKNQGSKTDVKSPVTASSNKWRSSEVSRSAVERPNASQIDGSNYTVTATKSITSESSWSSKNGSNKPIDRPEIDRHNQITTDLSGRSSLDHNESHSSQPSRDEKPKESSARKRLLEGRSLFSAFETKPGREFPITVGKSSYRSSPVRIGTSTEDSQRGNVENGITENDKVKRGNVSLANVEHGNVDSIQVERGNVDHGNFERGNEAYSSGGVAVKKTVGKSVTFSAGSISKAKLNLQLPDRPTFRRQVLEAHNRFRARHGVPPLRLSDTLSDQAQKWAERGAKTGSLERQANDPKNPRLGENVWCVSATGKTPITGEYPVQTWYEESTFYDFKNPLYTGTKHFTQIVWKSSREIGVGIAVTPDERHAYVVCNYDPSGNVDKAFHDNVLPLSA